MEGSKTFCYLNEAQEAHAPCNFLFLNDTYIFRTVLLYIWVACNLVAGDKGTECCLEDLKPQALPSGIWCCLTKSTSSSDPPSEELRNVPCPILSGSRSRSNCVSFFWFGISKRERERERMNNLSSVSPKYFFFYSQLLCPSKKIMLTLWKAELLIPSQLSSLPLSFISQYSSRFTSMTII